jgi:hypothetical protein
LCASSDGGWGFGDSVLLVVQSSSRDASSGPALLSREKEQRGRGPPPRAARVWFRFRRGPQRGWGRCRSPHVRVGC